MKIMGSVWNTTVSTVTGPSSQREGRKLKEPAERRKRWRTKERGNWLESQQSKGNRARSSFTIPRMWVVSSSEINRLWQSAIHCLHSSFKFYAFPSSTNCSRVPQTSSSNNQPVLVKDALHVSPPLKFRPQSTSLNRNHCNKTLTNNAMKKTGKSPPATPNSPLHQISAFSITNILRTSGNPPAID